MKEMEQATTPKMDPVGASAESIMSIVIDQIPAKRTLPIDIESVTPRTARTHPDLIANLTEAIGLSVLSRMPGSVYPILTEAGIKVKKYEESAGKNRRTSRFYVLRENLPQIVMILDKYAKEDETRKRMKKHPELYVPLFELIQDTKAHIASRRAVLLLKGHEIEVAEDTSLRPFVSRKDIPRIIDILQSMDVVTQDTLNEHPELLSSLGSAIKESGIPTTPDKLAELLPYFDIQVKIEEIGSSNRYLIRTEDKPRIIAFLQGLGKELLD